MAAPSELLECSWGSIRLFASQVHTDSGRTQVVHELSSGDEHPVQDRGLRVRRVRCKLQFDDFPGAPSPIDAARALESAKDSGKTAIFQHPLLGRFLASVGEFNSEIDESSVISAECEFIKESADQAVTPTGAASSGASGESSVAAAATALDAELEKVGALQMSGAAAVALASRLPGGITPTDVAGKSSLSVSGATTFVDSIAASVRNNANALSTEIAQVSAIPIVTEFGISSAAASLKPLLSETSRLTPLTQQIARLSPVGDPSVTLASISSSEASVGNFAATTIDARIAVQKWNSGDVPTRQIMIDAARISNNIATMIEVGGFEDDIQLWPAFRASIMLGEAVRSAAIAATSETPTVFVMRIMQPTALLPLAARIYGGSAAQDRARQIVSLNDIPTPGWMPPGDYLMPTRSSPSPF